MPAAVSGTYPATGRDIYGTKRVTRDILELRAEVEPGDSGGPLVLEDGSVGGLVFAESKTDPAVGYALTPGSVWTRIQIGDRGDSHGGRGRLHPLRPGTGTERGR